MGKARAERRGFTLVELLIVIAIIVVLMAIILPVYNGAREKARQSRCMANLHNIAMAIRMYRMDEGAYPGPYDPVSGQWGLNSLYPAYITSRQTLICPDDPIRDAAGYLAQIGPGVDTPETLREFGRGPDDPYYSQYITDYNRWPTYERTYGQLITVAGHMYLWDDPAEFQQRYSSYNNFYNYMGYAWWPMKVNPNFSDPKDPRHLMDTFWERCDVLSYTSFNLPMARGENISAIFAWYRWDPTGVLNLDYYNSSSECYPNFECVERRLLLHLAQQVFWRGYPEDPEANSTRFKDDLGRPLWDPDDPNANPYGLPSTVFPGLGNRNAPDNTIITRCPYHRPWTKTRLPRQRAGEAPERGEREAGQEGKGSIQYHQRTETAEDFVLRLDGSVQMVGVLGTYNWAVQSQVTR